MLERNKGIPYPLLILFILTVAHCKVQNITQFDDSQILCVYLGCEQCIKAPYCYWCHGEVFLSSGSIIWGYCMMAIQSEVRLCEMDRGDTFMGNDTGTCTNTNSRNETVPVPSPTPSGCPYNGCNMCTKSENCSWCKLQNFDLWSCMGVNEVAEFGTICKDTCVDINDNHCQYSTCSLCTQISTCTWCGGQYTSLNGNTNYTWGFCLPENSSNLCQIELGDLMLQCEKNKTTNTKENEIIIIDENPMSIEEMSNPYEDPCTAYSTCTLCMTHPSCGWCSGPLSLYSDCLPWGECRGKNQKKNGEYGKQFCLREKGFWREYNCVPDIFEVEFVLNQYSVWDYLNWFYNENSYSISNSNSKNVAQLNNFLIGFNSSNITTTFLIKLITVQVILNNNYSLTVLFFQRVVQPLVPITHDLLNQQCNVMIEALWGVVPNYLSHKTITCKGDVLQYYMFISEITIEEMKTDNHGVSSVLKILFFWPVLLVLLLT